MSLYLNRSRARREFKKLLGPANHLIVTALIGLDAVENGIVKSVPVDLHAAWNPKDPRTSARRARRMVLDLALVRAIDALDVYIRMIRRAPSLVQDIDLRNKIDGARSSIWLKVSALESRHREPDRLLFAMALTMIAWRNRSAHSEADVAIDDEHRDIIHANSARLELEFRGLDAARLLAGFDGGDPSFKETASLIGATQKLVEVLDATFLSTLDPEKYLQDLLWYSGKPQTLEDPAQARKRRIQSLWGRDPSDVPNAVTRHLQQEGLADARTDPASTEFDDRLLNHLYTATPKDIFGWLNSVDRES